METGVFSEVSLEQFISAAKITLKIETSDNDLWFLKLANEGVRHLDCLSVWQKKQCTLTVNNNMAKLPNGYSKLIGIRVSSGGMSSQLIYVDLPFIKSYNIPMYPYVLGTSGTFQIQGGYIYITNNPSLVDEEGEPIPITEIQLAYWGINVDENGLMIGYEDYERAITAYICWMYTLQNADQYNQYIIEKWEGIWKAQKKWIKGKEVQDKFHNTRRQIASTMNAWISSKTWTT